MSGRLDRRTRQSLEVTKTRPAHGPFGTCEGHEVRAAEPVPPACPAVRARSPRLKTHDRA